MWRTGYSNCISSVGFAVETAAGIIAYPIDTIRRRMMMQSGAGSEKLYNGSIDCMRKIYVRNPP